MSKKGKQPNRPPFHGMISILCPSRGRPELAKRMIETVQSTASLPVEILLYLNDDDPELERYKALISSEHYQIGPDRSPGYSWNRLAEICQGEILFLMGDDATFETKGWDKLVEHEFSKIPDRIVCVYPVVPNFKKEKNPHFCVHRNWVNALGYFVPPHFWHWYVDTWTRELARRIGRYIRMDNFPLPIELHIADDTVARKDRLSLRERDHWLWEKTQRHRDADVHALQEFIRNYK
jgi:hypothetical protein